MLDRFSNKILERIIAMLCPDIYREEILQFIIQTLDKTLYKKNAPSLNKTLSKY